MRRPLAHLCFVAALGTAMPFAALAGGAPRVPVEAGVPGESTATGAAHDHDGEHDEHRALVDGLASLPEAVRAPASAWAKATLATPKLVTLAHDAASDSGPAERLRARLQVLGDKTFSNREWRGYWERQANLAGKLASALDPGDPSVGPLRAWADLAAAKVENQDRYLNAIETERDAIEDRVETLLDAGGEAKRADPVVDPDGMTPFERRHLELSDLARRIEQQKVKRATAISDRGLIERQIAASDVLVDALRRDVELARRERRVARDGARGTVAWRAVWQVLQSRAQAKVEKLEQEAQAEAARGRARKVEAGLLRSQTTYRESRIKALESEQEELGSFGNWLGASRATLVEWTTNKAWKIGLGLLLIALAVRLVLRVVDRLMRMWIKRAEGDPDDTSDDDTRALTLANVFSGIARPTVYGIAALVALETVGVNTGPLLGSVAILGLAVSFGSQNLVRDVVNGFFILLEHQYAVGEFVEIGGKSGTVERITIRSTWIRQGNGDVHVVPNGSITVVSNMTRDWSRAIVHVGVAYDADLAQVKAICNEVGAAMLEDEAFRDALEEAPAWVGVTELGDSAVVVRVMAKVRAGQQWAVQRALNERLKVGFDAAGIEIPFPQRVVWTKGA